MIADLGPRTSDRQRLARAAIALVLVLAVVPVAVLGQLYGPYMWPGGTNRFTAFQATGTAVSASTYTNIGGTNVLILALNAVTGGGTGGVSDHTELSNLTWTASGHTGTPARLAGFFEGGAAGYAGFGAGIYLDGDDNLAVSNEVISGAASGLVAYTWGDHAGLYYPLTSNPSNFLTTVDWSANPSNTVLQGQITTAQTTGNANAAYMVITRSIANTASNDAQGAITIAGAANQLAIKGTNYANIASNIAAAARAEALVLSNKQYFSGWSPGPIYTNTGAVTEEIWVLNSTWGDLARGYELDIITNAATAGWRMYVYDWRTNAVGDLSWVETTGTPTAQDWRTLATLLPFTPPRPRVAFLGANYPFDGSNMVRTAAGTYTNTRIVVDSYGNITNISSVAEPVGTSLTLTNAAGTNTGEILGSGDTLGIVTNTAVVTVTNATANAGQVLGSGSIIGIGTNTTEGTITLTNSAAAAGVVDGSGSTWGVGTNTSEITGGSDPTFYGFIVTKTNLQTFAANTFTKITWDIETLDPLGQFDLTNERYTAVKAGVWQLNAGIQTHALADNYVIAIYTNGVIARWGTQIPIGSPGNVAPQISTRINLASNDYVEVFFRSVGQTFTNTANQADRCFFDGNWEGP